MYGGCANRVHHHFGGPRPGYHSPAADRPSRGSHTAAQLCSSIEPLAPRTLPSPIVTLIPPAWAVWARVVSQPLSQWGAT